MKHKEEGRRQAWLRIRRQYENNLKEAPPEDLARVKTEYRAAKTRQYRKQFREDFPEYEKQIDTNVDLARLANVEIKKIIAPFYPPIQNDLEMRECRIGKEQAKFFAEQFLIIGSTSIVLALYDIIKLTFCDTKPSKCLNLIGVCIIILAVNRKQPRNTSYDSILSFADLVQEMIDHPNNHPARQYPNDKNYINDRETNSERSH